jgi:hypothetical protein
VRRENIGMTRRRLLLLAAAACLLLAAPFVARWVMTPAPGVTLENFKRLHDGMALDEVASILGRPPDDRKDYPANEWPATMYSWKSSTGKGEVVIVHFIGGGLDGEFLNEYREIVLNLASPRTDDNLIAKIRRWLGL